MANQGKKYLEAVKLVEANKSYAIGEAVALAKKAKFTKFDGAVELHLRMGVDPRASDQQVRGVATLPHGLGKQVRVLVFVQGELIKVAQDAGADFAGADDIIKKIEEGWTDFDVSIATSDMMGKVGKLGKVLGRKGLMPNPKSGTVIAAQNAAKDLPRVITEARKGRVEFRLDRTGIIHAVVGKTSFEAQKLQENLEALVDAIVKAKPSGVKGQYIKSASINSTMGPGIHLDLKYLPVGV
jgi:large subunit ribosomal protein L1